MPRKLTCARFLLVSGQQLVVPLQEGDVTKDVVLALFADVDGVAEVSKRGLIISGDKMSLSLNFLPFLLLAAFR